jgi:hypothetical protein
MKRGGGAPLVRLAVPLDGLGGVMRLDLDPPLAERVEHRRVGLKLAVSPAADDETLGQLVLHLLEVIHHERVTLATPPIGDDAVGQDDQIASVLLAVDDDPPKAVVLKARHRGVTVAL